MKTILLSYSLLSGFERYKVRTVLYIALAWTLIDSIVMLLRDEDLMTSSFFVVRAATVFIISCLMGYLFVFTLRNTFQKQPVFVNFIFKTFIVILAAFLFIFSIVLFYVTGNCRKRYSLHFRICYQQNC